MNTTTNYYSQKESADLSILSPHLNERGRITCGSLKAFQLMAVEKNYWQDNVTLAERLGVSTRTISRRRVELNVSGRMAEIMTGVVLRGLESEEVSEEVKFQMGVKWLIANGCAAPSVVASQVQLAAEQKRVEDTLKQYSAVLSKIGSGSTRVWT